MGKVEFVTVTELSRKATALVAEVERTERQVVVTKKGRPVALLQGTRRTEKGRRETVTNLKNNALPIISEIEETGKRLIITRDGLPVAVLQKVEDSAFCIEK